jgi:hypothetical protein
MISGPGKHEKTARFFTMVSGRSNTADGLRNCHSDPMFSTEGLKRARQKAEIVQSSCNSNNVFSAMQVPNICLTIIHIQNASDKHVSTSKKQCFFSKKFQDNQTLPRKQWHLSHTRGKAL